MKILLGNFSNKCELNLLEWKAARWQWLSADPAPFKPALDARTQEAKNAMYYIECGAVACNRPSSFVSHLSSE